VLRISGENDMGLKALGVGHIVEFGNRNSEVAKRAFNYRFKEKNIIQNYSHNVSIFDAITDSYVATNFRAYY
jgi:hypothetical protein